MPTRAAQEAAWLELTRVTLPGLAATRGWPVRADHCFQRILLDAVTGGVWYDAIPQRPAYRHMSGAQLAEAIALARDVIAGVADLRGLNDQSLAWRRKRR
ncbi:MAG: GCN5-related N-acetyltransferase [Sphingomonas taxi]